MININGFVTGVCMLARGSLQSGDEPKLPRVSAVVGCPRESNSGSQQDNLPKKGPPGEVENLMLACSICPSPPEST